MRSLVLYSMVALVGLVSAAAIAQADTLSVNCAERAGELKGLHRQFSGGFATYANTEKLRPYLDEIGTSMYRMPVFRTPGFFKGKTVEDAQNPEMYNFSDLDTLAGNVKKLGMELFATIAHVPPQLTADSTPKGAVRGENLQVYAEAVKHAVMHLTQGWANGSKYTVRYWEIWNEPDLAGRPGVGSTFYTGAQEDLFNLYAALSKAIESIQPLPGQPEYKVGGPAFAHLQDWYEPFLEYCNAHELPLDFFSFHHYDDNPEGFVRVIEKANAAVRKYPRFAATELILDEWNMAVGPWGDVPQGLKGMEMVYYVISNPKFSTPEGGVHLARSLMILERSPVARTNHFVLADNGIAQMGVITCPEIPHPPRPADAPAPAEGCKPKLKFYVLKAFEMLQQTPDLVKIGIQGDKLDAMAGASSDKQHLTVLMVNWGDARQVSVEAVGLPWAKDKDRAYTWVQHVVDQPSFEKGEPVKKVADGKGNGPDFKSAIEAPAASVVVVTVSAG